MDIILTHTHSDFDALGATVAAAKLYAGAVPVLQPLLDPMVKAYVAVHKDVLGLKTLEEIDLAAVKRVIVVDTQSRDRLGKLDGLAGRPDVEWVVYDHHPTVEGDMPPTPGRRELVGSATTLVVQELERRHAAFTPIEATTMALGVYVDTGHLTFPGTTPQDARAVAYLLERGADLQLIGQYSQITLDPEQQALLQALVEAAEPRMLSGHSTVVVGAAWPEYVSGIALVTHKLMELLSAEVIVVVVQMGKRTQFVARSRSADVDVRRLLAPYEGRGHAQAASAHQKELPHAEAVAAISAALPDLVPPEPTAADLMSAPVRSIPSDTPVDTALDRLFRYGHNGFAVVDEGRLVGLVSRRDLDRALHHGLGHVPVKGIMSHRVITVAPEAPLSEVERLMIEHDIGRLPVMLGEKLVGIVTRTDVLRVLYAHHEARRHAVRLRISEIAQALREVWPAEWMSLVERIGVIAGDRPLYLVGGAVRDLLLGKPNLDVDLVVDGDAIALAKEATAAWPGAELHTHEAFGTAQLTLPDGRKVDFATARTEFYAYPAALPTVDYSSIKQDLARRDFSVNAMAVRLNPHHFGELLDFFSSRQDLERGVLRVLHNLSFIEDPTRILRAVRFERQLGFRLDAQSEAFARYAMATGKFDMLGGERNKVELRRLLSLDDPRPAAQRLVTLDAWRLLHPLVSPGSDTWRAFRRAKRVLRLLGLAMAPRRWLTYLAIVLSPLSRGEVEEVLRRLQLAGSDQAVVLDALDAAAALAGVELAELPPAERYHRLQAHSTPALVYLAVTMAPRERRALLEYWRELHPLKLAVSGRDLKALGLPPGPRYNEILKRVLDARLNGEIASADEERTMLAHLAREALEEHR